MKQQLPVFPILLICASLGMRASDPQRVEGPVLGFVFDRGAGGVRPILGIAGASYFGEPVALDVDTSRAAISSVAGYVLAATRETGRVTLFRDFTSGSQGIAIENAAAFPDRIILSPNGSAAALLYGDRNAIQVFANLPSSPQSRGEISLFGLPGPVSAIAITDDGGAILAGARNAEGRESVVLLSPGADPRVLGSAGRIAAAAFFAGKPDAVFADTAAGAVYRIRDVRGAAEFVALPGGELTTPIAIQVSSDDRRVLVAGAGAVTAVDLEGGAPTVVSCNCTVSGLDRLRGNSVFRVTEMSAAPSWLLDAGTSDSKFLFIPRALDDSARGITTERRLPRPTAPLPQGGAR